VAKDTKSAATPMLRFPKFRGAEGWDCIPGDELFDSINNRDTAAGLSILAITQQYGAIPRDQINYHVSVTDKSLESYKVVEQGDFIISLRSFQGGIEYSNYRGICSPAYVILRRRGQGSDWYFKYLFKSHRFIQQLTRNIEGLRDGKMISYKQFSQQLIPTPIPAEQQKIADCLASLDEVISAQGRKVEAFKAHKRGLMQQLFPRESEAIPRLRFPEFRTFPEWPTCSFEQFVVKSFYGTSSSTSEKGQYPVLRMGNMVDGGLDFSDLVYIDLDRESFESIRLFRGDILLNRTNSLDLVGKISLFNLDAECITASYIVTYRLDQEQLDSLFCNYMLNTPQNQAKIKALAHPSISQANINPTTFRKELVVSVPSPAEQQLIANFLSSLDLQIAAEAEKLETLKAHKKGLMQQLFPLPKGD
jgi:type I restriction enzyme S subunit